MCLLAPAARAAPPQPALELTGAAGTACPSQRIFAAASGSERQSCRQGEATAALGWRLIEYGIATVKYVVGLLLILLGGLLVAMGWAVSLMEALIC